MAMLAIVFGTCTLGGTVHLLADAQSPSPLEAGAGYGVLVVGISMLGVAAVVAERPQWRRLEFRRRRLYSLFDAMPVAVAVLATAASLTDAAVRGGFDRPAADTLTVVVSSVLLRQSWTLADNRTLASSLRQTVDDLEHQATHDASHRAVEPWRPAQPDRRNRHLSRCRWGLVWCASWTSTT